MLSDYWGFDGGNSSHLFSVTPKDFKRARIERFSRNVVRDENFTVTYIIIVQLWLLMYSWLLGGREISFVFLIIYDISWSLVTYSPYFHSQLVFINSVFTLKNCHSPYFLFKFLVHITISIVILNPALVWASPLGGAPLWPTGLWSRGVPGDIYFPFSLHFLTLISVDSLFFQSLLKNTYSFC